MLLGSKGIMKALTKGDISIAPFHLQNVQPNSYDVSIDAPFYKLKISSVDKVVVIDPRDFKVMELWDGPLYDHLNGKPIVRIAPHSIVLASTVEVIGAYRKYSTLLKTKSTIARLGLDICPGAGFGDVGFVNRWTLEIINHTSSIIVIPVGCKVAQISFLEVKDIDFIYSGSYGQQEVWEPAQMLPVVKNSMM